MIIISGYGKFDGKLISKKLGISISNIDDDGKQKIKGKILREIYIREMGIRNYKVVLKKSPKLIEREVFEVLSFPNFRNIFKPRHSIAHNLEEITSKLVILEVNNDNKSLLSLKNEFTNIPSCEENFTLKFLALYEFIVDSTGGKKENFRDLTVIYDPNKDFNDPSIVMNIMGDGLGVGIMFARQDFTDFEKFGNIIDNFLEREEDFWKLDYLMDSINFTDNYNSYYLFKVYSLFELLLINPKGKNYQEIKGKLPLFMNRESMAIWTSEEKREFANLIRIMRNKIAHGAYSQLKEKLLEYEKNFMKDFLFDEWEMSREKWIYLHICGRLNEILKELVWMFLTDKEKLMNIQYNAHYIELKK